MTNHLLQVRAARDQVIDLLGFGQTYPIRELAVHDETLTVAYKQKVKIPIEASQTDVLYQLHFDQSPVRLTKTGTLWVSKSSGGTPIEGRGNGDTLILETYPIEEDITFEIYAKKVISGIGVYLQQGATVKVGLNMSLRAWIRENETVTLLDPTLETPTIDSPRLTDYGQTIEVEIENSQEGVDYELVIFEDDQAKTKARVLSSAKVQGDSHNIVLTTLPMDEDTDIYIRATKTFDPSENREAQISLLTVVLPLKVRANPALAVSVDPRPIIAYNQAVAIKLIQTQVSATYQLYVYPLLDRDFVYQTNPERPTLSVEVSDETMVQVPQPAREKVWTTPLGHDSVGEAHQGTGGDLILPLPPLTDDSVIIVRAQKDHLASRETAATLSTALQLEQAALVLTEPNPDPSLRVQLKPESEPQLQVFDGQPGVFYTFHLEPEGQAVGLPTYFHQRDHDDPSQNKGLGQLRIEGDFVISRAYRDINQPSGQSSTDFAHRLPASPILDTVPLPSQVSLQVLALRASTRVSVWLAQPVEPEDEPQARS